MRWVFAFLTIAFAGAAAADEPRPGTANLGTTIDRGLAFLAKDARAWRDEHKCVSCHHASLIIWSMREAKELGHKVDEPLLTELTNWVAEAGDGKFAQARPANAPKAASPKAIYFGLALSTDPKPDAAVQKGLGQFLKTIASEQADDGAWYTWPETRPPIFGSSTESLTLLATLAVLPRAAGGDAAAKAIRDKSVKWLAGTKTDDDPQSVALRLVLWTKLGRPEEEWRPLAQRIKERQNSDGGWSQTNDMPSDAWSTGQALYALAHAGTKPDDPPIQRGREFLVKTQRPDGSWPMTSRPTKPGDKGCKSLIPITGAGSAWAVLGLVRNSMKPAALPQQPDAAQVRPFKIAVDDAVVRDLNERLARTRWPDQIDGSGWDYGVPLASMKELVQYWQTGYDWRAQEKALNKLDQFVTRIDGLDIHFVHVRSKAKNALPLVLVHGWPGSFVEFQKVIAPLTDPVAHGGKAEDAFHVVVPSLPGFGFSAKPTERGWNSQRMAEVIAKLMSRIGYDRYGAQGGDWGGGIVRWMAAGGDGHCIGSHSNFPSASQPADDPMRGVTEQEMARMQQRRKELTDHYGYGAIQGTRPLTLGYGLNDSPAGLAAWIIDKFWAWSDHHGKLDNSFTRDELLTNVMIYWVTQSMPSSTRIYFESSHNSPRPGSMTPFDGRGKPAPLGFALFPKEINVPPRAWVERNTGGKLIHWTEMPRGGHFAAMEEPKLLVEDVRSFFRKVR